MDATEVIPQNKSKVLPFHCDLPQDPCHPRASQEEISRMKLLKDKHLTDVAYRAEREESSWRHFEERLNRRLYGVIGESEYRARLIHHDHEDPCSDPDMPFIPLEIPGTEDYCRRWREHFRIGIDLARRRGHRFRELDNLDLVGKHNIHKARIAEEMGLLVIDGYSISRVNYRVYCERNLVDPNCFCLCHCRDRDECPVHRRCHCTY